MKQTSKPLEYPLRFGVLHSRPFKKRMCNFRTQAVTGGICALDHKIKARDLFLTSQTFDDSARFPVRTHPVTNGLMLHVIKPVWNKARP